MSFSFFLMKGRLKNEYDRIILRSIVRNALSIITLTCGIEYGGYPICYDNGDIVVYSYVGSGTNISFFVGKKKITILIAGYDNTDENKMAEQLKEYFDLESYDLEICGK